MPEYIDITPLVRDLTAMKSEYDGITINGMIKALQEAPTADVAEVRHGHWRQNLYCERIYYCSECGRHIEDGSDKPLEYFPYCHCGAKMDGKGDA